MNYISKNWDKDTDAVIEAVQAFHEIGSNTDKLVQHMIPVTGLIESLNIVSESSKNYISQLVKGMPQDESDAAFLSLIYDYFSKGQADTSVELTELYKNGQFGSNTAITEAYQLLLDSSNIQEQMEKLNIDVNKQTENIEVLENKIGSIVESVDGVSEKIDEAFSVFCKYFLEKVASCFSIVLQLHFPQCCKLSFPAKGERESLQAYVAEVD